MDKDYIENVRSNHLTVLKESVQLKSTLKQKDGKISDLETKLRRAVIELKSKSDQLEIIEDKIPTLETELSISQQELSDSKEKLKLANKDIAALKLTIEQTSNPS
jgi:chromosome segregation ATPase|tara:strand:+ start:68 stop:382 length:315 start_codon:yes stop_codon:yes gene_type:complete